MGESLVLIDLQRLARADLPKDDLASILMRAYGRREVEDVAPLVGDALRVTRGGLRQESRGVFIP